jgi:hypothetical protein
MFFIADIIIFTATPPHYLHHCILIDYFNNSNFSKAQIIRSLMMVIKQKHVGAVLMFNNFLKQLSCASVGKYEGCLESNAPHFFLGNYLFRM